jgi:hypothetical protein
MELVDELADVLRRTRQEGGISLVAITEVIKEVLDEAEIEFIINGLKK